MKTPTLAALLSGILIVACGTGPEGAGRLPTDDDGDGQDAGVVRDAGDGGGDAGEPDGGGDAAPDAGVERTWIRDWVVSPAGADTAAGTAAAPLRTIVKALSLASPGERILVKAGTYPERVYISGSTVRSGTALLPIRLQGEGVPKLIPQASSGWTMVQVDKSYWEIDGFEIDAQGQAKVAVGFGNASVGGVLTNNNIHGGSHNSGVSIFGGATGVRVERNEIHHFQKVNDDSHGVHVQYTAKDVTIRGNTIHDNSGDSVQCEGPEPYGDFAPAQGVVIEDNEMYGDREQAVDIKTCHDVRISRNAMHHYAQLGGAALVVHYSANNVTVEDNLIHDVGKGVSLGGNLQGGPVLANVVLKKNRIWNVTYSTTLGYEGVGVRLENVDQVQLLHNTIWKTGFAAIRAGGGANYGIATSNATLQNNILAPETGSYAYYLGSALSNFKSSYNLIAPNAQISAVNASGGREALSFSAWKATGQETGSRQADPALDPATLAPGANAVDWGLDLGFGYCGAGPDVGAVETGCP